MTSKRQVTLPKELADAYGIGPGDEIHWEPAGDHIRVVLPGRAPLKLGVQERLALFDEATRRHEVRWEGRGIGVPGERGWTRADLHDRARPR